MNEVTHDSPGLSEADLCEARLYMAMLDLFRCHDVTHHEARARIRRSAEQARLARIDEIRCARIYADVQSA